MLYMSLFFYNFIVILTTAQMEQTADFDIYI